MRESLRAGWLLRLLGTAGNSLELWRELEGSGLQYFNFGGRRSVGTRRELAAKIEILNTRPRLEPRLVKV